MDWSQLFKDFAEAISPAIQDLLVAVLVYASGRAAMWFRAKYEAQKSYDVDLLIQIAVRAAEQLYKCKDGEAKFDYAINLVEAELARIGFKIDIELLTAKIEAAVMDEFNYGRKFELSG